MGHRSIINQLVAIRSIFAHARKNKVITKDISPLGEGDGDGIKIKFPNSKKIGIFPGDVDRIEALQLKDPRHDHARHLWLFCFYFAGMRVFEFCAYGGQILGITAYITQLVKMDKAGSLKVPDQARKSETL